MNELRIIITLIFLIGFQTACNTKTVEKDALKVNANSSAQTDAVNNSSTSSDNNLKTAADSETKNASENINVPANANIIAVNAEQPKEPIRSSMPAPDDSMYSAEMNKNGQPVESRTFKSHPVLAKIEKITLSPRDYVFKIYLKNGKVIESKSPDLKDFRVIAPVNILDAVNIKPPPAKPVQNSGNPDQQKRPVLIPRASP